MKETLPIALKLMFGHEGGYVNVKTDAGGPTKYGITHRTLAAARGVPSVTAAEVKRLSLTEAEQIYRKSYWGQSGGDVLPVGLDYAAFDFGVNSGPATAVKQLQKTLGVNPDGSIGEMTVKAIEDWIERAGLDDLIRAYIERRMKYLRSLGGAQGWRSNGRGWTIRVTGKDPKGQWKDQPGVIGHALELASGHKPKVDKPASIPNVVKESGKAPPGQIGLPEIVKKPEVWLPGLGAALTAISTFLKDFPIMQYVMAGTVVVLVAIGAYYFVQRIRRSGNI